MNDEEKKRQRILEINRDQTLTQQQKSQQILQVLAGKWLRYSSNALSISQGNEGNESSSSSPSSPDSPPLIASTTNHATAAASCAHDTESSSSSSASSPPSHLSSFDPAIARKKYDLNPTYRPGDGKVLGCKHYFRGAKLLAVCCDMLFTCRFCHDEYWNDHKIVRYDTKSMLCMHCQTVQPIQQSCAYCEKSLGDYYCSICKFHDSTPNKSIYHCHECGLCRVGERDKYFHCKSCRACYQKQPDGSTEHECHSLDGDCPICGQNLFTSTETITFMRCGHAIHSTCMKEYTRTNFICPVCRKSLGDTSAITREIDLCIQMQPMPEIFRNTTVQVLCNDCLEKSSVPFHFLGSKCASCQSYNTSISSYSNMPTRAELEASSSSSVIPDLSVSDPLLNISSPIEDDDDGDDEEDDDDEDDDDEEIDDELEMELFDD